MSGNNSQVVSRYDNIKTAFVVSLLFVVASIVCGSVLCDIDPCALSSLVSAPRGRDSCLLCFDCVLALIKKMSPTYCVIGLSMVSDCSLVYLVIYGLHVLCITWPHGYKTCFICSIQLSMTFIMLINV